MHRWLSRLTELQRDTRLALIAPRLGQEHLVELRLSVVLRIGRARRYILLTAETADQSRAICVRSSRN